MACVSHSRRPHAFVRPSGMSRAVLPVFEEYQKARLTFVQTVADLATRPQNVETLQNAGVMSLLRPLLLDTSASIQQSAALALGRLANLSDGLAEDVVACNILPHLVQQLQNNNRFYKKAASFVLRAVAKHSPRLAQEVVNSNALMPLVDCLEEFDPSVKEAAAWAVGYIVRHNKELAASAKEVGAAQRLVLCLQEPELPLKRISASVLSDICKHSVDLATAVVDAGAVSLLANDISHPDAALKRQVGQCLAQIAKHSVDLAVVVVEAEVFPRILNCLTDSDEVVRKNSATCIREIARHTPDLAKLIVNAGGVSAIVDYITEARGNHRLPGIITLGFIAGFTETLAFAVIVSKGIGPLKDALINEPEDHLKAAAAWTLGQIGRHTPDHAKALAETDVLRRLLAVFQHPDSSEDLRTKAKWALKNVIMNCNHLPALEPLLIDAPDKILKYVVQQFSKVLPSDAAARRSFVQSGGLRKIQEVKADPSSRLNEYVEAINGLYPTEIVNYYSKNYEEALLSRLEEHNPQG